MKKIIFILALVIIVLGLFLISSKGVLKNTSVEKETKLFVDGKFGFFRDAEI